VILMSTSKGSVPCSAQIDVLLDSATFIAPSAVKETWHKLGNELDQLGYNTAGIDMPRVEVFVLPFDEFVALIKTLENRNLRWQENIKQEYGRVIGVEESAAFLGRAGDKYVIGISKVALVYSEQDPLGHELLHVWEDKLHLTVGTLTKALGNFLQGLQNCRGI